MNLFVILAIPKKGTHFSLDPKSFSSWLSYVIVHCMTPFIAACHTFKVCISFFLIKACNTGTNALQIEYG